MISEHFVNLQLECMTFVTSVNLHLVRILRLTSASDEVHTISLDQGFTLTPAFQKRFPLGVSLLLYHTDN